MVSLKRPDVPTQQQRERFAEWKALLILWDTKQYGVAELAQKFGVSRQALDQRLRNALRARKFGWI